MKKRFFIVILVIFLSACSNVAQVGEEQTAATADPEMSDAGLFNPRAIQRSITKSRQENMRLDAVREQ